jgi:hypothetical protein
MSSRRIVDAAIARVLRGEDPADAFFDAAELGVSPAAVERAFEVFVSLITKTLLFPHQRKT